MGVTPFGRYRLIDLLGRGGMGDVWRAHDTVTNRVVAVKILPRQFSNDRMFQERLRRNAGVAARLNIPRVVPIHDIGEIDGRLFVEMQLVEGQDLGTLLRRGPLPPQRAINIVEQIAEALFAGHKVGWLHRDVKPSNIILTGNDSAHLIDSCITLAAGSADRGDARALAYTAPEWFASGAFDARSDEYALTGVLYEALTGVSPFAATTPEQMIAAHMRQPPPRPSSVRPQLPPAIDRVIAQGMAKEPERRFGSTKELAAAARAAVNAPQDPPTVRTASAHFPTALGRAPEDTEVLKNPLRPPVPADPRPPLQEEATQFAPTQFATPLHQTPPSPPPPSLQEPAPPKKAPGLSTKKIWLTAAALIAVIVVGVGVAIMFTGESDSSSGNAASPGSSATGSPPATNTGSPESGGGGGIFSGAQPWNTDVSGAAKSGRSDAIIGALNDMGGWGTDNKLQIDFSIPIFFADSDTPQTQVVGVPDYCFGGPDCDSVPAQMPVPSDANIEGSQDLTCDPSGNTEGQGDCHLLVVDEGNRKLYETYQANKVGDDIATQGFFVWDLDKEYPDNLRGEQCTSADAGGFPIAAMTPTADEVAAGSIDHAIRFILPNDRMKADVYVHPASHAGGPESTDANAPPYGVRFRLKADFDDSGYTDAQRVVITALKTYGMLLADGGQVPLTFADDRTSNAKWADLGITADTFAAITPDQFEVVELGEEVQLTFDCVRNP